MRLPKQSWATFKLSNRLGLLFVLQHLLHPCPAFMNIWHILSCLHNCFSFTQIDYSYDYEAWKQLSKVRWQTITTLCHTHSNTTSATPDSAAKHCTHAGNSGNIFSPRNPFTLPQDDIFLFKSKDFKRQRQVSVHVYDVNLSLLTVLSDNLHVI